MKATGKRILKQQLSWGYADYRDNNPKTASRKKWAKIQRRFIKNDAVSCINEELYGN